MSAAASATPATVEAQGMPRREGQGTSSRRDGQSYSHPSRTQSTRSRPSTVVPSPVRANSSNSRPTSRRVVDDVPPQQEYEIASVAQSSRKRSTDRSNHTRTESTRSGHHRSSSRHYAASDMTGTTAVASVAAGPAPVVVPLEQRATRQGRSRTVIPAQTGNWILGKTIGSGSMGKVKLARRVDGAEEVHIAKAHDHYTRLLTSNYRLLSR